MLATRVMEGCHFFQAVAKHAKHAIFAKQHLAPDSTQTGLSATDAVSCTFLSTPAAQPAPPAPCPSIIPVHLGKRQCLG